MTSLKQLRGGIPNLAFSGISSLELSTLGRVVLTFTLRHYIKKRLREIASQEFALANENLLYDCNLSDGK